MTPCVVPCGGALSCCDPLRRAPEASITAETYQWAKKSPQRLRSVLGKCLPICSNKLLRWIPSLKCCYLDGTFKKKVCYWGMSYYWFQRTVLTPSWSIVKKQKQRLSKGGKKCFSFMLGVNWLPLRTNFSTLSHLWCLKGDIKGREWIEETDGMRERVSENETEAWNISEMCEDCGEDGGKG